MDNFWLKKSAKKKIDKLIDNFDFDKIHSVMSLLNWTWFEKGVPTVDEMKKMVLYLFDELLKSPEGVMQVSSGGFCAEKIADDKFGLSFCVAQLDSYDLEEENV